jgi:hypothetical protein
VLRLGYESHFEVAAGKWCSTDEDIMHAAREPVSLASDMDALAKRLGIGTPELLAAALEALLKRLGASQTHHGTRSEGRAGAVVGVQKLLG